MTTIAHLRAQITELDNRISDLRQADLRRDARSHGHDEASISAHVNHRSTLQAHLIRIAKWDDLETDGEREQWIMARAVASREYLREKFAAARLCANQRDRAEKLNREVNDLRGKLAAAKAELHMLSARSISKETA